MKTLVTVAWAVKVAVEVEPEKLKGLHNGGLGDPAYIEQIQIKAITEAYKSVQMRDGIVADCEDFPQLAE